MNSAEPPSTEYSRDSQNRQLGIEIQAGSEYARARLTELNLGFAYICSQQFFTKARRIGLDCDELVQQARVIVYDESADYDGTTNFLNFIRPRLKNRLRTFLLKEEADRLRIPTSTLVARREIIKAEAQLVNSDRPITDENLLDYLVENETGIGRKRLVKYRTAAGGTYSLRTRIFKETIESFSKAHRTPLAQMVHEEELGRLNAILSNGVLTDNERTAVKLYYGIDSDREYTFQEIGVELGASKQRAKQLVDRAVEKIQTKMTKQQVR